MAIPGPTTTRVTEHFAGNLLKLARIRKGFSQRQLAAAAGVPHTTVVKIETGARQPSWPVLCRLLAAADLEPRVRLEPYDSHDDVLDATTSRLTPQQRAARDRAQDEFLAKFRAG